MAGSMSDYLELEILDHIFGNGAYTPPTIYAALFTTAPTDAGGGVEVSGGSYAREAVATWNTAAAGATANTNEVAFTQASADWGTVVAFGLFDALTVGNLLYWGDLTTSKAVNNGDTAKFAAGDIDITQD